MATTTFSEAGQKAGLGLATDQLLDMTAQPVMLPQLNGWVQDGCKREKVGDTVMSECDGG